MSGAQTPLQSLRLRIARHEAILDLIASVTSARDLPGIARIYARKIKYIADVKTVRFLAMRREGGEDEWEEGSEVASLSGSADEGRCDYLQLRELDAADRALLLEGRVKQWESAADPSSDGARTQEPAAATTPGTLVWLPCTREREFCGGGLLLSRQPLDELDFKFLRSVLQIMGEVIRTFLAERAYRCAIALRTEAQHSLIQDLSRVICPVSEGVLLVPIAGPFGEERSHLLTEHLYESVKSHRARLVILDLTGVSDISPQSSAALARVLSGLRLIGSRAIVAGLRPQAARYLIGQNVSFADVCFRRNLSDALTELKLTPRR